MNIIIERTIELNAPLLTEPLPGSLFTTESKAHQFLISCTQNGAPVTLSGTVSAKFIREANNTTILMSGSISGGKASLILPADCYNISGRFDLTIFVTSNNVTTCVYSATGSVKAAQDGTLVDEGTVVPSIEQLQQDIENLQSTKVNRDGDTMTGSLSVPGLNALGNYPGMAFRQSAGSTPTGYITENNATRRMYFTVVPTDAGGNEVFNLPAPSTGNVNQRNFDIITTKNPASGLAALGGVAKSGDTMTGTLTSPRLNTKSASFPAIWYMTDDSTDIGYQGVRVSDRRYVIAYRNAAGINQQFSLPPLSGDTSESTWYDILTSKSPVTVAQGGTGLSGTTSPTLTPGANVAITANSLVRFGPMIALNFVVTVNSDLATGATIATIGNIDDTTGGPIAYLCAFRLDGTFKTFIKVKDSKNIIANAAIPAGIWYVNACIIV